MKDVKIDQGVKSGGSFAWFFQRISGAILLLALLAHFWVLHFFAPHHGEITFDSVMMRLQHPVWKGIDLLFLIAAIYHGMNGVILVINDYLHHPRWRMLVVGVLWVGALWFLLIGAMTILSLPKGGF